MKSNFKCPKCHKGITVGKRLHASYHCPRCHYAMVLSKQDVAKGTVPYKPPYWVLWGSRDEYNPNFKKKFEKSL